MKINFAFERETKGAVRYSEVDAKGAPLEIGSGATIGKVYFRKTAWPDGDWPKALELTVKPK